MTTFDMLYSRGPVWLQNIACSLYGIQQNHLRYGNAFNEYLCRYLANQTLETRRQYQKERLAWLFSHSVGSPFWKEQFYRYGVNVDSADPLKELGKLPIISKEDVHAATETIMNPEFIDEASKVHTSGTTGAGLELWTTKEVEQRQWAIWWRYRMVHGLSRKDWQGCFGGRSVVPIEQAAPPYWRLNYPGRQVLFSQYHLSRESAHLYHREITERKLTWLHGYPSQLSLFASYVKELSLGPLPTVKVITTGAENLLGWQRDLIETTFCAKVIQHYGLREGVANISEIGRDKWVVDDDFCVVEFVPLNSGDSAQCRIIGTALNNVAFPLFRYDTGDIATVDWSSGKDAPAIISIDGRQEDMLVLKDGSEVGRLDHVFKALNFVREAQIRQDARGCADFIIVKRTGYDENNEEKYLKQEIDSRFGSQLDYSIHYVDSIPKTKSGKLRLVVSGMHVAGGQSRSK